MDLNQAKRWRLIWGGTTKFDESKGPLLEGEEAQLDLALSAIYDQAPATNLVKGPGGSGKGVPNLAKWLADVRSFFPSDIVSVIQADAIERKGLKQLLFEPESLRNCLGSITTGKKEL
ncbi:MAG: hypothetical protein LBV08_07070 [Clostridiales bacterium]|jgi:hypothetical protein|nr:hypothetical protein [Clostridiales bacterium]